MVWHVIEVLNAVINVIAVSFALVTVGKGYKAMKMLNSFGKGK